MPMYTRVIYQGKEVYGDPRRAAEQFIKQNTVQGERVQEPVVTSWEYIETRTAGFRTEFLRGQFTIHEEALGYAYVCFRLSATFQEGRDENGCVVSLICRTFPHDSKHSSAHELQLPYCITGVHRPYKSVAEAFGWMVSDYLELIVDPDEIRNLETLAENAM